MKVLILMSATGGGHRSVSLAVEEALHRLAPGEIESRVLDVFALEKPTFFDRVTRLYGPAIQYAPWLYGAAFHMTDSLWGSRTLLDRTSRPLVPKIRRLIQAEDPSLVVTTHPLCNKVLMQALREEGNPIPRLAVVTELVTVHRSWVESGMTHYTVATPQSEQAVLELGAPPERVSRLGLPINESFGQVTQTVGNTRLSLGLDPAKLTLLLVGGGEGTGNLKGLVEEIAATGLDLQLLVVCGRNERLRRELRRRRFAVPVQAVGFVNDMPELMHAADVILTKGGPQSLAEALASGRPIIVTQTVPGQEEGNAEFVEKNGAGFDGRRPRRAVDGVRRLARNPQERFAQAERAQQLAQPEAASETAKLILELGASVPR